jgi:sialate O-acetylesterase
MIRYAWQDNPPVNLINSDGLPAMPFRTDSLPLVTRNNR